MSDNKKEFWSNRRSINLGDTELEFGDRLGITHVIGVKINNKKLHTISVSFTDDCKSSHGPELTITYLPAYCLTQEEKTQTGEEK